MRGVTLIELVIAISVIAVAAATLLGAMSAGAGRGAKTLAAQQMAAVANAYLQEIMARPFTPAPNAAGRANFNDIQDYQGLSDGVVRDQTGNPVAGLAAYSVAVSIVPAALGGIAAANARLITVIVTGPGSAQTRLSAYKTNHP